MSPPRDKSWPPYPVAIIGMSCRLPGARDLDEFWRLLCAGESAISAPPKDRWDLDYYFHPDVSEPGRTYARAGGFLPSIAAFDAHFFGISPREARQMDVQQRLLLELTWEALEAADLVPAQLAGSDTSVFIGASSTDFGAQQRLASEAILDPYAMSGSASSILANRLSHFFDFHGPSLTIDTACSSSLVALHSACESLRLGQSRLAVVGGINLLLTPEAFVGFAKAAMLSREGRCAAFDAGADGYVRSEGGGIVVLKPLEAALADGNPILAVIRGSGVNSDGRTKGIAMPNPVAQETLLREVYAAAGIDPGEVDYVEAHGTGTIVGDRVECTALGRVIGAARPPGEPCWISSVKTNIGHLEPASGIAGLIKAVLVLRHRAMPRTVHFSTPNPKIAFDELNLAVVKEQTPLPARARTVVGVSSFGFGGTNAHVALESAPTTTMASVESRGVSPFFLSARSPGALKALAQAYARLLRAPEAPPLAAIAGAAVLKRSHHPHRVATFGARADDVAARLEAFAAEQPALLLAESEARYQVSHLAFVFSGNGSQWLGMGSELLREEPIFAATIARIDAILRPLVGWSLLELLQKTEPGTLYDATELAQPALFALQVGLVELLRRRGITAEAMVGHSVGEIAAAHAAGALSLEDACLVIARRSAAQGRTAGAGKMAAVGLSAPQAEEAIARFGGALSIAGVNSPTSVTIAGDPAALDALRQSLKGKSVYFRLLALDYAFHSAAMDPLRDEIVEGLAEIVPRQGERRFISTVTGAERPGPTLDAGYWWDNVRKPVLLAPAIQHLAANGFDAFVEIGPHPILAGYLRECLQSRAAGGSTAIPTLRRAEPESEALWMTVARCYTAGVVLDFEALFPRAAPTIALPAYPWQREPFWFAKSDRLPLPLYGDRDHPLLGYRMPVAQATWRNELDLVKLPYLADHVVQGSVVLPAAAYVEIALAAARHHLAAEDIEVEGLEIRRPLVFAAKGGQWIEANLAEDGGFSIRHQETPDPAQPPIVVGRVGALAVGTPRRSTELEQLRQRLCHRFDAADHYARCAAHGLAYGPAFQTIAEMWTGEAEALARLAVPGVGKNGYCLHPAVLDGCFQTVIGAIPRHLGDDDASAYVPTQCERLRFFGGGQPTWCHAELVRADRQVIVARFVVMDGAGNTLADIDGMRFRRVGASRSVEVPAWHWQAQLQPNPWQIGAAADLPAASTLAAKVRQRLPQLMERSGGAAFRERAMARLDRLAAAYATRAQAALGSASPAALSGLLARFAPSDESPETLWRALIADCPDNLAAIEAVARCGERLPALVRGEQDGSIALFPERDFSPGEQLLDSDPALRLGNDIAAAALEQLCGAIAADRPLRVLEIAGGAGGLAAAVLPALPAERVDYVLTDVSEAAVARAQAQLGHFPFLRTEVLDIERDLAGQAAAETQYDVVLAAHALHAATGEEVLARLRALVLPGGLLIAIEAEPGGFLDLVLGVGRSGGRALLPAARWSTLLTEAGFVEIATVQEAGVPAVLIARNALGNGHAPALPSVRSGRQWLVLSGDGAAASIGEQLADIGACVLTIADGDQLDRVNQRLWRARLAGPDDFRGLAAALREVVTADVEIVYARSLSGRTNGAALEPMAAQEPGSLGLVLLVQALAEAGLAGGARLTVVTRGAMAAPADKTGIDPAQAPLWGVARTLMNERPDMRVRLVDIDPGAPIVEGVAALLGELLHEGEEDEVILRGAGRYAHRLERGLPAARSSEPLAAFRLVHGGKHDGLDLEPMAMPEPGAGEVVVRVRAAGLNYRDVLQRVGVLPEEAFEGGFAGATLGMEYAGEVVAVGPGVTGSKCGDPVFGFAPAAFSSHLKTPAAQLLSKPPGMSFAAAATLPVAMLTVYYALHHVARLRPGERVLIHGGAGGVGLAAIQYAQWVGAEIFASAGTPGKRDFLRRLGVPHIVDSRSLAFADEIREITRGEGIDVVLNSLAGDALYKGVSLLRPYGRFVELGKRDFWANTKLGLQPFRNNIQFSGVDVDRLLTDRPALAAELLRELGALIADGVLHPLPYRAFPVARAVEAFRHMQQSRHIGKVVLSFDETARPAAARPAPLSLRRDGTYLVTGGRGGFGLATAEWLVQKGARHLVLIGRSRDTKPEVADALQRLREQGAAVREFAFDVGDAAALERMLTEIGREMPVLRGVFHCAAVIEDAALANMTPERFRAVLWPKIKGATELDRLTRRLPLDLFVLYSSAVTLLGNPGQANYAAANLYLEALAARRRADGLPATAVLWGAIDGVGHLARHGEIAKAMSDRLGIKLIAPERALARLEQALAADVGHVALAELNWTRLAAVPQLARSPKYARVRPNLDAAAAVEDSDPSELRERLAAMPRNECYAYVQKLVINHLSSALRMPAAKLDVNQSLLDLGMDSLMVVELQLAMEQQFAITISPLELMDVATVSQLVQKVAGKLGVEPAGSPSEGVLSTASDIDTLPAEMLDDVIGRLLDKGSSEGAEA